MKNDITVWIESYNAICRKDTPHCPKCNSSNVKHEFRAKEDKIGYALISCDDCGASVHISRVEFPRNVETLPM